jgi:KDO2-lipid IV(A) lauroyltransferase
MGDATGGAFRCATETVAFAHAEQLLREHAPEALGALLSPDELANFKDGGADQAVRLAGVLAAKQACLKLFPQAAGSGAVGLRDFVLVRSDGAAPRIACSASARAILEQQDIPSIVVALAQDATSASAVVLAETLRPRAPFLGRLIYRLLPIRRRVIMENLRRVFGDHAPVRTLERLAQAHYAHLARLLWEFLWFPWVSAARRRTMVRVENLDSLERALGEGRGVLVLTGHFGSFEVATAAGLDSYPHARGRFYFVRRPIKPGWLDDLVTRRFVRVGFGVLPKRGGLDALLDRLAAGDLVVFPFDQHASRKDGVMVPFFRHPAGTFRSLAVLALSTGAPVVPAASWREPGGRHVLRFEAPLAPIEHTDTSEAIRLNTRAYNAALEALVLRHPEQWWWIHRRWKPWPDPRRAGPR